MQKILQSYLRRLTNLTTTNRSLLLLRLVFNHFIDLHDFDFLKDKPSFNIIEALLANKNNIPICRESDSRFEKNNIVSKQLKKLFRTEKFIFEERGSKDLYVAWPFVAGKFSDGTPVRAPLLFFPVSLVLDDGEWSLKPRQDVNITLNKSFILAYAHYNKIKLDESLSEWSYESSNQDSTEFRTMLYQLLKDSAIELNFNADNFTDQLVRFPNQTKKDFQNSQKSGELKLYPQAVLGIFPQAGSYIVPDYANLIKNEKAPDLEAFFHKRFLDEELETTAKKSNTYRFISKIKEEHTITPYPIDAHQENALKAIKKGNSVVIQGPPGTGKSQLIANLISDYIAQGKSILLVCQKRAALDVVHNRLKEKDIADFAALVHDFKNDRKEIYQKIAGQVDNLQEYQLKNNSLDAIQLERKFQQSSRRIDQITEELEEFKEALFDENECGVSAKELYLTASLEKVSINIKQGYRFFKPNEIDDFLITLKAYSEYAQQYHDDEHPWFVRNSFKSWVISDQKNIEAVIKNIPVFTKSASKTFEKITNVTLNIDDCEPVIFKEKEVLKMLDMLKVPTVYKYFKEIVQSDQKQDLLWLANTERVFLDCFRSEGPEISLNANELGKFQETIQRAIAAKRNFFGWLKWRLFTKDSYWIKRVIVANDIKSEKRSFDILVEKIDNRLNLEHSLSKLKERKWLIDIPQGFRKADFQAWFYDKKAALASKITFVGTRNLKEFFHPQQLEYAEFKEKIKELLTLYNKVVQEKENWKKYLTPIQINKIISVENFKTSLTKSLKKDFDSLCEFDKLNHNLKPHEKDVIDKLFEQNEAKNHHEIEALFTNSLRLAWLEHIETKYPCLRYVSSKKFEQLESTLQSSVKEKLGVSREILLLKARERTYENAEYNRLKNRVTYKDLYHQVSKKRRIWPIRKLISNFTDELFTLVPCWMASPESVSALFPMEEIFDLVIFDEASQCYAEKGIPAMYRGKQIVIAGDDKQLTPNDLYKVRWEDEDEDTPALEVDSLLDLASQYLMQLQLKGHYRSRSLALIDFSNQNFYNGNLSLLPDFNDINKKEPTIEYIKVAGVWDKNTNQLEADKIVALIKKLAVTTAEKQIGVVTFNAKQQGLIMDKLDEEASSHGLKIPESLFVKNIENVQGDERDIIIFSTAYAPDKKGKMTMQFGSLNMTGGENRLNVAITRAKEKIYIITSILPHELNVDNAKNEGPKLLKKYLQYAKDVSDGKFKPEIFKNEHHHIDWFLKNKIAALISDAGERTSEEIPFADLSINIKKQIAGLVLTDDGIYHQSVSIKESHVYKPFALIDKNWKFSTFHSREFWQDQEIFREKVMIFLNSL